MAFWTRGGRDPRGKGRAIEKQLGASRPLPELPVPTKLDEGIIGPVSRARIAQWFQDNEFHYFLDSDGDLGGIWHSRLFFFFLLGEDEDILQIRSQWNRQVSIELLDEVLPFCNEWNTQRVWPKTYVRVHDDGIVQVCAETAIDLEKGVNNDQLRLQLICGLSSQSLFWDALDEEHPDPVGRP